MVYTDLWARIEDTTHRTDLASKIASFTDDATDRINRRFGLSLASPTVNGGSTNDVLTNHPLLYVYAACQAAFEYLNNGENAIYMANAFERECNLQNITNPTSATDVYAVSGAPYIKWSY